MERLIFSCNRQALARNLIWIAGLLGLILLLVPIPSLAEYGDVIFNKRSEKAGLRPVIFPHWFHRIRYNCSVCHTEAMHTGAKDVLMADIIKGKYCGECHNGKIAWGPENCQLCHSGLPGLQSGVHGGDKTDGPGKW